MARITNYGPIKEAKERVVEQRRKRREGKVMISKAYLERVLRENAESKKDKSAWQEQVKGQLPEPKKDE